MTDIQQDVLEHWKVDFVNLRRAIRSRKADELKNAEAICGQ
jgi:hypothetical protein